ncbi:cyclophilin type peptidyl-prolyl cis-trans isomerase/CLD [Apiospora kogelbergensis]|uniref:cyclophilin type peptidyl-prolyl cis-trans isomerase/CLD n=1 Tax=Apiospora kogelbergensis TaxID=1337665 RepID=UPI0031310849
MSSIYNLEPQPTASLILKTNQGDLSVELFAKQTPITSRNFLQLCLDGYYDNTIFHRLVPGFIIQGGDPTGTGNGGECIYDGEALSGDLDPWPADQRRGKNAGPMGVNFKDEFHSRLKFTRRGLLGMANEGKPDTNSSQFFFTLDKAEELNNKNTVFGRIVGDTIYNLARMGESEVAEGSERPMYQIKITGVEILVNPFTDMTKRERTARKVDTSAAPAQKKKKQAKGGKKLLSFGDEEGDADAGPVIKKAKKFDTRIVMDVDEEPAVNTISEPKKTTEERRKKTNVEENPSVKEARDPLPIRESRPESRAEPESKATPAKEARQPSYDDDLYEFELPKKKKSALEQANEEIAALKASMKRSVHAEPETEVKKTGIEQFIPETAIRGRKRRRGGENAGNKELSMFEAFKARLEGAAAPPEKENPKPKAENDQDGAVTTNPDEEARLCDLHFIANCQSCQSWADAEAEKEDDNDDGWMGHALSAAADKLGKDLSYRKKADEELMVIDPREKARTLKEEKRAQQEARSGASGREWDQARNQKLARQSAMAGRGAR